MSVDASDVVVTLNEEQGHRVRESGAQAIAVGVRPEYIAPVVAPAERPAAAVFNARVDVIEALGNEIHATLLMNERSIVVRLPPDTPLTIGQEQRFSIAPERLLLFDQRDGRLIA
jgi:ABC-type sugar transport system ATPase subunit